MVNADSLGGGLCPLHLCKRVYSMGIHALIYLTPLHGEKDRLILGFQRGCTPLWQGVPRIN